MYAVELTGIHVGMSMKFRKKYTYNGENREKDVTIKKVYAIRHDGNRVSVYTTRELNGYYAKLSHFALDTEVTLL
jgi:hypothetical protein